MSALIGWGIALTYLVVAMLVARCVLQRWHRLIRTKKIFYDLSDGFDRGMLSLGALGLGVVWPAYGPVVLLHMWLWRPIERERVRAERRRDELARWENQERTGTNEERQLAREVLRALRGDER